MALRAGAPRARRRDGELVLEGSSARWPRRPALESARPRGLRSGSGTNAPHAGGTRDGSRRPRKHELALPLVPRRDLLPRGPRLLGLLLEHLLVVHLLLLAAGVDVVDVLGLLELGDLVLVGHELGDRVDLDLPGEEPVGLLVRVLDLVEAVLGEAEG